MRKRNIGRVLGVHVKEGVRKKWSPVIIDKIGGQDKYIPEKKNGLDFTPDGLFPVDIINVKMEYENSSEKFPGGCSIITFTIRQGGVFHIDDFLVFKKGSKWVGR